MNRTQATISLLSLISILSVGSCLAGDVSGEQQGKMTSPYYSAQHKDTFVTNARGIDWEFEVRVSVPGAYDKDSAAMFPVLWVLDGSLYHGSAAEMANVNAILGRMPYAIVVSVGYPANNTRAEYQQKRTKDFFFGGPLLDLSDDEDPATRIYLSLIHI